MASAILHCFHSPRWVFRIEHVCGRRCGELSPLPRRTGERRESQEGSQESATDGEEAKKLVNINISKQNKN